MWPPIAPGVHLEASGESASDERGRELDASQWAKADSGHESVALPGEYEPVEHVLIGWSEDAWLYAETFDTLVRESSYRARTTLVYSGPNDLEPLRAELKRAGVRMESISFVQAPLDSMWMRDYGPLVVRTADRSREVVDFDYPRENDDQVPALFADRLRLATRHVPIAVEGGHLQADGTGRCILSADMLARNRDLGTDDKAVVELLRAHLGCHDVTVVPSLYGEDTGHIDIFLYVTGPGQVLLGRYRAEDDRVNAVRLDRTATKLRDAGFHVSRIPMPPNRQRKLFRTYTNALAVEDAIFVPVYRSDRRYEREALRAFERAFPTRVVVPIAVDELLELGGALHCIAMTVASR